MDNSATAHAFFEACDYGKGWSGCRSYCHDNASFETAAETLAEINTLDTYCDWMVEALAMFDKTVEVEVKSEAAIMTIPNGSKDAVMWVATKKDGFIHKVETGFTPLSK